MMRETVSIETNDKKNYEIEVKYYILYIFDRSDVL